MHAIIGPRDIQHYKWQYRNCGTGVLNIEACLIDTIYRTRDGRHVGDLMWKILIILVCSFVKKIG